MDENSLRDSIKNYENQLSQVELMLQSPGEEDNSDLIELRSNLQEVIALTTESLLSLKKASLLEQLEANPITTGSQDREEIPEYDTTGAPAQTSTSTSNDLSTDNVASTDNSNDLSTDNIADIIGTCVRAPFSHSWGHYQYHNAAIIDLDPDNQKVVVMFCQPTHMSMKICPYFLDGNRCRKSESQCTLSHGHSVHIDELREYETIDSSNLSVGDSCLARFPHDDLWYKATIVDVHEHDVVQVMYDLYGQTTHAIERTDIIPYNNLADDSSDSSASEDEEANQSTSQQTQQAEEDEAPCYLWKEGGGDTLAQWESHTRGVGSKLMAAMGYQLGQGLGKDSQGRIEPVPILKLPPGKSLDRIMELKERAGDKEMFDVLKRKKGKHKLSAPVKRRPKQCGMFSYINNSLSHGSKVDLTAYRRSTAPNHSKQSKSTAAAPPSVISRHQMSKKSDRSINVQVVKTDEEISKVENEILGIRRRLEVNASRRDTGGVTHLKSKLEKAEKYLETLKRSHRELTRHQGQREGRKKLTIF